MPAREPRPSDRLTFRDRRAYNRDEARTAPQPPPGDWVSLRRAAAILRIHPNSFYGLFAAAGARIRILEYPGKTPLYSREDVERVASESIKVAVPTPPKGRRPMGVA